MHALRRAYAACSIDRGIDGAPFAHRHDHARDLRLLDAAEQDLAHLLRRFVVIILGKEDAGLELVADEAVGVLQQVAALHRDIHIGDHRVDPLMIFFRILIDALDDFLLHVDLQNDAVAVPEDLISALIQRVAQRQKIRPLGNGGVDVAVVVKDRKPCPHAVRAVTDKARIHLVVAQLRQHVRAHAGVVHKADKRRPKLHVCNVLHHVPAHAAMDVLHDTGVPALRDIIRHRIALDIYENCAEHNDSHEKPLLFASSIA